MSTNDIENRIRQLLADYRRAVADEIREELLMALGGRARQAKPVKPVKRVYSVKPGPKPSADSRLAKIRVYVGAHPGCTASDVRANFGDDVRFVSELCRGVYRGVFRSAGKHRSKRYWLAQANGLHDGNGAS